MISAVFVTVRIDDEIRMFNHVRKVDVHHKKVVINYKEGNWVRKKIELYGDVKNVETINEKGYGW